MEDDWGSVEDEKYLESLKLLEKIDKENRTNTNRHADVEKSTENPETSENSPKTGIFPTPRTLPFDNILTYQKTRGVLKNFEFFPSEFLKKALEPFEFANASGDRKKLKKQVGERYRQETFIYDKLHPEKFQNRTLKHFEFLICVDLECTCACDPFQYPHEIIEFPAVLIDVKNMKIIDQFRTYVRPALIPELDPFCVHFTHITQEIVDNAPFFREALEFFYCWMREHRLGEPGRRFAFVTDGPHDLWKFMQFQCILSNINMPHIFRHFINIKHIFRERIPAFEKLIGNGVGGILGTMDVSEPLRIGTDRFRTVRLRTGRMRTMDVLKLKSGIENMLNLLGRKFEGHAHSGLDDSRNIAKIVVLMIKANFELRINQKCYYRKANEKEQKRDKSNFNGTERHLLDFQIWQAGLPLKIRGVQRRECYSEAYLDCDSCDDRKDHEEDSDREEENLKLRAELEQTQEEELREHFAEHGAFEIGEQRPVPYILRAPYGLIMEPEEMLKMAKKPEVSKLVDKFVGTREFLNELSRQRLLQIRKRRDSEESEGSDDDVDLNQFMSDVKMMQIEDGDREGRGNEEDSEDSEDSENSDSWEESEESEEDSAHLAEEENKDEAPPPNPLFLLMDQMRNSEKEQDSAHLNTGEASGASKLEKSNISSSRSPSKIQEEPSSASSDTDEESESSESEKSKVSSSRSPLKIQQEYQKEQDSAHLAKEKNEDKTPPTSLLFLLMEPMRYSETHQDAHQKEPSSAPSDTDKVSEASDLKMVQKVRSSAPLRTDKVSESYELEKSKVSSSRSPLKIQQEYQKEQDSAHLAKEKNKDEAPPTNPLFLIMEQMRNPGISSAPKYEPDANAQKLADLRNARLAKLRSPEKPEKSKIPETSRSPEKPKSLRTPETPRNPENSRSPEKPESSTNPEIPAQPDSNASFLAELRRRRLEEMRKPIVSMETPGNQHGRDSRGRGRGFRGNRGWRGGASSQNPENSQK